jgi:hypothetical protein
MSALANDNLAARKRGHGNRAAFQWIFRGYAYERPIGGLARYDSGSRSSNGFPSDLVFAALELLAAVSSIKFARPNASTPPAPGLRPQAWGSFLPS